MAAYKEKRRAVMEDDMGVKRAYGSVPNFDDALRLRSQRLLASFWIDIFLLGIPHWVGASGRGTEI